jgi:hypothetical protein
VIDLELDTTKKRGGFAGEHGTHKEMDLARVRVRRSHLV